MFFVEWQCFSQMFLNFKFTCFIFSHLAYEFFLDTFFSMLPGQQTEVWIQLYFKTEILLIYLGRTETICRCPWTYLHVPKLQFFSQTLPLHFSQVSWNLSCSSPDVEQHAWFIKKTKWITSLYFLSILFFTIIIDALSALLLSIW